MQRWILFAPATLAFPVVLGGCSTAPALRASAVDPFARRGSEGAHPIIADVAPDTRPALTEDDRSAFKVVEAALKRPGEIHGGVCTITIPRDDLYVTSERMEVPTEAGIESRFNFYHCSCGKMSVVGEFVVTDYESNDVIDALRSAQFTIASMGPLLLYEHPRLLAIHFKGEGETEPVAEVLKKALSWTGKERDRGGD